MWLIEMVCDNCSNVNHVESGIKDSRKAIKYKNGKLGWIYTQVDSKEKHFCCQECYEEYLKEVE